MQVPQEMQVRRTGTIVEDTTTPACPQHLLFTVYYSSTVGRGVNRSFFVQLSTGIYFQGYEYSLSLLFDSWKCKRGSMRLVGL